MKSPLATAVAIATGLIVLLGAFLPIPLLSEARTNLLGWAAILAGVAALVAVFSLCGIHWGKFTARRNRDGYSFFFLLAFVITFALGMWYSPADPIFQKVVTAVQVPIETSLMAVLTISLAVACLRLFQKRRGAGTVFFAAGVVFFVLLNSGALQPLAQIPVLKEILTIFQQIPTAGARGILIGVALGSLLTGIRILSGMNRPYSG